jgi:hypothetical protein
MSFGGIEQRDETFGFKDSRTRRHTVGARTRILACASRYWPAL